MITSALLLAMLSQPPYSATDIPIEDQHPCAAGKAQSLIGQVADAATVAEALRISGASTARIVRPGQPIAMDYQTYRLTVEVDTKNKIIRLSCG